jgi:alkylhydroperoxidase/carboxymuconolactone decarboxylase family protein YurZ
LYSLDKVKKLPKLAKFAPEVTKAFWAYDKAALACAIPKKYKQLMAIAVALTTQCVYCIEIHRAASSANQPAGSSTAIFFQWIRHSAVLLAAVAEARPEVYSQNLWTRDRVNEVPVTYDGESY